MKRIRTAKELYAEFLKAFYFGKYKKNDQLMTYRKLHETYGLSKNIISAAYEMLRHDGFIRTDGANGTIVIFDVDNPQHVAKVPLEWARAGPEGSDSYELILRLQANTLYKGLMLCDEHRLQECKRLTQEILQSIHRKIFRSNQVFKLWMQIVCSLNNEFLYHIIDHFISRYFYFVPPERMSKGSRQVIYRCSLEFYQYLLDAFERQDFQEYKERFWQYYSTAWQEGGIVFAKLEKGAVFKEYTLYFRLLDDLSIRIMTGELKKGDTLPTTAELCKQYHISKTTVNRAYGFLIEMGLISRKARSGTRLIAEPNDHAIHEALETAAGNGKNDWRDALEALTVISGTLSRYMFISQPVIQQMRLELARQRELFDHYGTPFLVSSVLISPLIAELPTGILHQYYSYLTDTVNRVMTLCTFRLRANKEHGEEVYQMTVDALNALMESDQSLFAIRAENAMRRNEALLREEYDQELKQVHEAL